MTLIFNFHLFLTILLTGSRASIIDDVWSSALSLLPIGNDLVVDKSSPKLPSIQYELPPEDEEFLKEGLKLINSPREALDACTHRVVLSLKKNCNQLNMEEIGKLAVMLLNCQLEIEGRQIFACTPQMTLKQCTIGMDSQMHQIYNYMLHRASAACFAVKQIQIKAAAEMTVNRLMQASQAQIETIQESLKNQKRLNDLETSNLRDFEEKNELVKQSQVQNLEKLKQAEVLIDESLQNLQQELELRKKSENSLNVIDQTAEEISLKIAESAVELAEGHKKLLRDVEEISFNLQQNNLVISGHFNSTMEFIENFKTVLLMLTSLVTTFKAFIDSFSYVMQDMGIEISNESIVVIVIDTFYFTLGMIFMLFVNVEGYSAKLVLVALYLFNACAALTGNQIELLPINILVWLIYFVIKSLPHVKSFLKSTFTLASIKFKEIEISKKVRDRLKKKSNLLRIEESESEEEDFGRKSSRERSLTPIMREKPKVKKVREIEPEEDEMNEIFSNSQTLQTRPVTPIRPMTPASRTRAMTPTISRLIAQELQGIPNRSATPFQTGMSGRTQCQALTNKNLQCKNAATPGYDKCRMHNLR